MIRTSASSTSSLDWKKAIDEVEAGDMKSSSSLKSGEFLKIIFSFLF